MPMPTPRRLSVTTKPDLEDLRHEALNLMSEGLPADAVALVTTAWGSRATQPALEVLRGEIGVRCGIVTGDEPLIEAALERLSGPEYVGPSRDLATAIGSLAPLELRSQQRGLLAYFGFDGRDLLRKVREDLRWLVWNTPQDDERDENLDDLIPGFRPRREVEHPTEWQLEEARATFARSYTVLGRTPLAREDTGWDAGFRRARHSGSQTGLRRRPRLTTDGRDRCRV